MVLQDCQTVFLLTNGNLANAANVVGLMVCNYAQNLSGNTDGMVSLGGMGTGAAMGWLLAVLTLLVALMNLCVPCAGLRGSRAMAAAEVQ